jgi:hypothetical protein
MERLAWAVANNGKDYPNERYRFGKWCTVQWNGPGQDFLDTWSIVLCQQSIKGWLFWDSWYHLESSTEI